MNWTKNDLQQSSDCTNGSVGQPNSGSSNATGQLAVSAANPFESCNEVPSFIRTDESIFLSPQSDKLKGDYSFQWTIDEASACKPAKIDININQFDTNYKFEDSIPIQNHIHNFFTNNVIVPSPATKPLPAEKKSVKKLTKDVAVQTGLSLPPNLPEHVQKVLEPYIGRSEKNSIANSFHSPSMFYSSPLFQKECNFLPNTVKRTETPSCTNKMRLSDVSLSPIENCQMNVNNSAATAAFATANCSNSSMVRRKILVLDLDETLIHSHHEGAPRQSHVKPTTKPDFTLRVTIERQPVRFCVYKRPHVDYFLDVVSSWYELVIFTASMEIYGAAVTDRLDNGRNILRRRYYRQHCTPEMGAFTKDLLSISQDLASVFILDNSPGAYRSFTDNAIPIKSWFSDQTDTSLLNLLPFLDALRFTYDVRSILSRNLHLQRS